MVVRGVIGDEVENETNSGIVQSTKKKVEVIKRAEGRVDRAIIRDIVAEISERTSVDRRQPHRVDAEPLQIVNAR
jgi:hypothetical protein